MQFRSAMAVTTIALVSACSVPGPDATSEATVASVAVPSSISSPAGRVFEARYDHRPGQVQTYDLSVRQEINYHVSGVDTLGTISTDPLPDSGRVVSKATSQISYDSSQTSTESSTTIGISAAFPEVESSAWADGDPIDQEVFDELTRALAVINPVDFMVGVNDRNAMLTSSGLGGLNVLNGEVGSLTSLSNNQLSRPLGPVFPESRQIRLLRPWTIETTQESPGGQEVVVTSEYTAVEHVVIDGTSHLRIEGTTQTGGFDLDFSDAFQQIYTDVVAEASARQLTEAELQALSEVVFSISVQPSSGTSEYLYDVQNQVVVSSRQESIVELVWVLRVPDTDSVTGSGFEFRMEIARRAEFSPPSS